MEKINIIHLHVIYNNYYTGIDRYIEMYKKGMQKNESIQVHSIFLTDSKNAFFSHISFQDGIIEALIPMPLQDKLIFKKDSFWKTKYWEVVIEIVTPYLKGMKNLIFHAHNTFLVDLADLAKKRFEGKIVFHLHCLPWKYQYNNDIEHFNKLYSALLAGKDVDFRKLEGEYIRYEVADKIICLSQVAKEYLTKIRQIPCDRIEIIENGLTPIDLVERNVNSDVIEILYAGKVSDDKGVFELLKALQIVYDKEYEFTLKIAGTCLNSVRNCIYSNFRSLDIQILGQVSTNELYNLYSTCTIGIVPSLYEQCSYVALEMAMFGVPMIISGVDALAEMFDHQVTALIAPICFDPDFSLNIDSAIFSAHIINLIENKDLRNKLSKNVQELYYKKYTLEKMINKTNAVYEQLSQYK